MSEYKVVAVSDRVRDFETKFGKFKSYRLKLEGVDDVVELARKATSDAPKAGDTYNGTLEDGQFGTKLKLDNNFNSGSAGGGAGSKPAYQPKDEKAIQAMWAIGQAVATLGPKQAKTELATHVADIQVTATELFALVDVIKAGKKEMTKEENLESIKETFGEGAEDETDKYLGEDGEDPNQTKMDF